MIERSAVVAEARTWIDTPYIGHARLKGIGVDCAGLSIGTGRNVGAFSPTFDIRGYGSVQAPGYFIAQCDSCMRRISREEMGVGDNIVMTWGRIPHHIGIVGDYLHGGLSIIHAYLETNGRGRVIETGLTDALMRRFVTAYRFPGVAA